jgi:hypothetical protein
MSYDKFSVRGLSKSIKVVLKFLLLYFVTLLAYYTSYFVNLVSYEVHRASCKESSAGAGIPVGDLALEKSTFEFRFHCFMFAKLSL